MDKFKEWLAEPFQPDNKAAIPGSLFLSAAIVWVVLVPLAESTAMMTGIHFSKDILYKYLFLFLTDFLMLGIFILTVTMISPDVPWKRKTGIGPFSWKYFLLILAAAVPVYLLLLFCGDIVQGIASSLHQELPLQKNVTAMKDSSVFHLLTCYAPRSILFAPVMEELCWRHIVFSYIANKRNATGIHAAVLTSLLFGIAHLNLLQAIPLALLGFILQFTYLKTKTIFAPILLHALINTITVIVILAEKGGF